MPRGLLFSINSLFVSTAVYDRLMIILGNINTDIEDDNNSNTCKLKNFCDLFGLLNLIKTSICVTKTSSSTIDLILTECYKRFQKRCTVETGTSDFHKMTLTLDKSTL